MLLEGQGGLGDQADCRRVEGHLSGSPFEQKHQSAGQQHTEGHRPGAPRGSWWSPAGDKGAVAAESGHGSDTLLVSPRASGGGGTGAVTFLPVSLSCVIDSRLDKPVGCDPFEDWMTLSWGSPKVIEKT